MRNSRSHLTAVLSWGALVVSLVFAASRTVWFGPNSGDIAVWIPVHEWISRGETLYASVWDHKDWGFFWVTQPFYAIAGITGMYLVAYLAVLAFGTGVYLTCRGLLPRKVAIALTAVAIVSYTASPSFLSVYTENMAIGLLVLGIGLMRTRPILGGCVFALAASVKISGLFIWLALVAVGLIFGMIRWKRSESRALLRSEFLGIAGFGVSAVLILLLARMQGSLAGWIDVIAYNRQYQAMRGFPPPVKIPEMPFAIAQGALSDLSELPPGVFAFLLALIFAAVCQFALVLVVRVASTSNSDERIPAYPLALGFVLAASTFLATISQRPAWHHWQFFVGALVLCNVLLAAVLHSARPSKRLVARSLSGILLAVPILTAGVFDAGVLPRGVLAGLGSWGGLGSPGQLATALGDLPPDKQLAIFGTNGSRIDYGALPEGSRLACKFFYQFDHLLPRYRAQIESCLSASPDVVIVEASGNWADEDVRAKVAAWLSSAYVPCESEGQTFALWVRQGESCPVAVQRLATR